jgi:hypothetical protein
MQIYMGCKQSSIKPKDRATDIEFMVLFESEDFEETFFFKNMVEKAKIVAKKLPGKFHTYDIADIEKHNLQIKGMPILHILYVKLPKECIYIPSEEWDEEYFNAQMLETINTWTELGAKEIKFSSHRIMKNKATVEASLGGGFADVNLDIGGKYVSSKNEDGKISGKISIDSPKDKKYDNYITFIENHDLFYISKIPQWRNIIGYKINNPSVNHIDFQYAFTRGFYCNLKLHAKFNDIGISIGVSNSNNQESIVEYDVDF